MRRLVLVLVVAGALIGLTAAPVAGATHERFNPAAQLDTSQVIDKRNVWGEMICPPDEALPCWVEEHPIREISVLAWTQE